MAGVDFDSQLSEKYTYSAYCSKVYDGDTITVDIDVGFGIVLQKQKIRLFLINTPEMRGPEKEMGTIVRDFVREKILGKTITIKTIKNKTGKYGRMLGVVFYNGENINRTLLERGYAVYADYK